MYELFKSPDFVFFTYFLILLGRSKAKGEFEFKGNEDDVNSEMLKQFSKYLMSSEISFDDGKICAGLRTVGNYTAVITPIKC